MKNFLNELFSEINDEWPILVVGFILGIIWTSILIF
jgi:high-affinity nickel permease